MRATALLAMAMVLSATVLGGCGGYYVLTVPDQLAPAGGEATAVVRLQRNDFFVLSVPVKDAALRFRIGEGLERGAYTDKLGYAGTTLPVPPHGGQSRLVVCYQDSAGEEVSQAAPVHVWGADRPVVAVDMDCLPGRGQVDLEPARTALDGACRRANILYLTRQPVARHDQARRMLAAMGYPDGPILLWQRQYWHVVRDGRFNMPRVVVERQLVSQLPELRKVLGGLSMGVTDSEVAGKAFADAGMRCALLNPARPWWAMRGLSAAPASQPAEVVRFRSWADLAERGIQP